MKKTIITLFYIIPFFAFSQIDKIGYSKSDLINSMNGDPCKSSYSDIWYCGDNGSLINFSFKNNVVKSVLYMWEFKTKYEADDDVKSEISKTSSELGRPIYKGDQAFWFSGNLLIMVTYGYSNGKHYSCWKVSEK